MTSWTRPLCILIKGRQGKTPKGVNFQHSILLAIKDIPAPTDKKGLERLLGTVNYLGKFIPNLASVTEPIRVLLRKDIEFQ